MDEKTALLKGTTVQSESSESETDVIGQDQEDQITEVEADAEQGVEIDLEDDGGTGADNDLPEWLPPKFVTDGEPNYESLAKSYTALEKKLGEKGILRPESVDEYEYEFQVLGVDDESFGSLKEQALEKGLSTEQFQFMLSTYEEAVSGSMESILGTQEQSSEYLSQKWGNEFDKNLAAAQKALDTFTPEGENVDAFLNHPAFIQMMAAIGKELGEDTQPVKKSGSKTTLTKSEVQKLMDSEDYWDTDSPSYRKVQKYFEAGGDI